MKRQERIERITIVHESRSLSFQALQSHETKKSKEMKSRLKQSLDHALKRQKQISI